MEPVQRQARPGTTSWFTKKVSDMLHAPFTCTVCPSRFPVATPTNAKHVHYKQPEAAVLPPAAGHQHTRQARDTAGRMTDNTSLSFRTCTVLKEYVSSGGCDVPAAFQASSSLSRLSSSDFSRGDSFSAASTGSQCSSSISILSSSGCGCGFASRRRFRGRGSSCSGASSMTVDNLEEFQRLSELLGLDQDDAKSLPSKQQPSVCTGAAEKVQLVIQIVNQGDDARSAAHAHAERAWAAQADQMGNEIASLKRQYVHLQQQVMEKNIGERAPLKIVAALEDKVTSQQALVVQLEEQRSADAQQIVTLEELLGQLRAHAEIEQDAAMERAAKAAAENAGLEQKAKQAIEQATAYEAELGLKVFENNIIVLAAQSAAKQAAADIYELEQQAKANEFGSKIDLQIRSEMEARVAAQMRRIAFLGGQLDTAFEDAAAAAEERELKKLTEVQQKLEAVPTAHNDLKVEVAALREQLLYKGSMAKSALMLEQAGCRALRQAMNAQQLARVLAAGWLLDSNGRWQHLSKLVAAEGSSGTENI